MKSHWRKRRAYVHLIVGSHQNPLPDIIRDLKPFTSRKLRQVISNNEHESRRDWMVWMLQRSGLGESGEIEFRLPGTAAD